jgi:NADPH-dependent 2,4-dienoyl-CoA reductase/sulfur reductase-like enzyme
MDALQRELDVRIKQPQFAGSSDSATKDLTRQLLTLLIQEQIVSDYARAHGITVDAVEVDESLGETVTQAGGQAAFQKILRDRHITVADVRRDVAENLLIQKVEDGVLASRGLPSKATADQRNQAFLGWLRAELDAAEIRVNPRFGTFDLKNVRIVPITSTAA